MGQGHTGALNTREYQTPGGHGRLGGFAVRGHRSVKAFRMLAAMATREPLTRGRRLREQRPKNKARPAEAEGLSQAKATREP